MDSIGPHGCGSGGRIFSISYRLKNSWNSASRSAGESGEAEPVGLCISDRGAARDCGFGGLATVLLGTDPGVFAVVESPGRSVCCVPGDNVCCKPSTNQER